MFHFIPTSLGIKWNIGFLIAKLILSNSKLILIFDEYFFWCYINKLYCLDYLQKGIGPLTIVNNGIRLEGQAWIVDKLIASTISSQPTQPVTLNSYRNFTVLVWDPEVLEQASLVIS